MDSSGVSNNGFISVVCEGLFCGFEFNSNKVLDQVLLSRSSMAEQALHYISNFAKNF